MTTKLIAREEPATYKVLLETARAQSRALSDLLISDVAQLGPGSSGEFDYIDIGSVNNLTKQIEAPKRLPCSEAPSRARQRVRAGDVLVSMTRPNLNAVALVPRALDGATASTGFHVLRAGMGAQPDWLFYAVQSPQFVGAMSELVQGALYPAVRPKDIRAFSLIVPTNEAQRKIVAYLDEQLSRLDASVAALQRAQANLKRYRASVLKSACGGRLVPTEAELARRDGRDFEAGAQLLQRILAERASCWAGRNLSAEPTAPDHGHLPALPDGWTWSSAEQLCGFITKGTTPSANKLGTSGEVRFLKVYNLANDGVLNYDYKSAFVSRETHEGELARSMSVAGDVLMNIVGPPLGQVCVVPPAVSKANINQAIARFRTILPEMNKYLAQTLLTRDVLDRSLRAAKTTVGQVNLTLQICREIAIPLPPLAEQQRIVAEADRRLSLIRVAEVQVSANLARAQRLRQSILQAAFSN